jgi:hypothetical protein
MNDALLRFRKELLTTRPKLSFAVRLQRVLEFTKQFPEAAAQVGVIWTEDNRTFLSYSKILAQFLSVAPNSINTNFREHGFSPPEPVRPQCLATLVPGHKCCDWLHWKQRRHELGQFTAATTSREASNLDLRWHSISMVQERSRTLSVTSPFQAAAMAQWDMFAGTRTFVPLDDIAWALAPEAGFEQLRINIIHLLAHELSSHEIISGTVPFEAFLSFFHRYGSSTECRRQLQKLTPIKTFANPIRPVFYIGFCLGANRRALAEAWSKATVDSWAFIEGPASGTFHLLVKKMSADREDAPISISVNPAADRARFIIEGERGGFPDLLAVVKHFGLMKESGLRLPEWQEISQQEWDLEMFQEEESIIQYSDHWAFLERDPCFD